MRQRCRSDASISFTQTTGASLWPGEIVSSVYPRTLSPKPSIFPSFPGHLHAHGCVADIPIYTSCPLTGQRRSPVIFIIINIERRPIPAFLRIMQRSRLNVTSNYSIELRYGRSGPLEYNYRLAERIIVISYELESNVRSFLSRFTGPCARLSYRSTLAGTAVASRLIFARRGKKSQRKTVCVPYRVSRAAFPRSSFRLSRRAAIFEASALNRAEGP